MFRLLVSFLASAALALAFPAAFEEAATESSIERTSDDDMGVYWVTLDGAEVDLDDLADDLADDDEDSTEFALRLPALVSVELEAPHPEWTLSRSTLGVRTFPRPPESPPPASPIRPPNAA